MIALACGLGAYWSDIRALVVGWVSIAAILVVALAGLLGVLVTGPGPGQRVCGGLVSAMRFTALALVLASRLGRDSGYLPPALLCSLLELLLVLLAGGLVGWGRARLSAPRAGGGVGQRTTR